MNIEGPITLSISNEWALDEEGTILGIFGRHLSSHRKSDMHRTAPISALGSILYFVVYDQVGVPVKRWSFGQVALYMDYAFESYGNVSSLRRSGGC